MKKGTVTIATLAIMLFAGTAIAQPDGMGMSNRSMEHRETGQQRPGAEFFQRIRPMLGILDLSDSQREEIGEIISTAVESMESIREGTEGTSHRDDFIQMFSSSTISAAEVENLLNGRTEVMQEMNSIVAVALVDIHNLLTPEQLSTLAEFEPGSMEMNREEQGRSGDRHQRNNMGVHPTR